MMHDFTDQELQRLEREERAWGNRVYRTNLEGGVLLQLLAVALLLPALAKTGVISVETVNMVGRYLAFAIAAVGLDLIWGYTGILSLCHSLFFALGGYAMGMHLALQGKLFNGIPEALYVVYPYAVGESRGSETLPWFWHLFDSFHLTLAMGMLIPGLLAALVGFFCFVSRVRGVYFSILTQALTVAATMFFSKNELKFCGTNGLTHFKTILGQPLTSHNVKLALYLFTLAALVMVLGICFYLVRSRFGKVLTAIRDSETALRFAGYRSTTYKTAVFAFGGAVAGLAGMLYVPMAGIITPSYMEAKWSILMVVWVAVGGRGKLLGAVLGALAVNLLYNFLTSQWSIGAFVWNPDYWPFVLGLLFLAVVLVLPGGLFSLWRKTLETPARDFSDVEVNYRKGLS
jgi:urea transport system permease protein